MGQGLVNKPDHQKLQFLSSDSVDSSPNIQGMANNNEYHVALKAYRALSLSYLTLVTTLRVSVLIPALQKEEKKERNKQKILDNQRSCK